MSFLSAENVGQKLRETLWESNGQLLKTTSKQDTIKNKKKRSTTKTNNSKKTTSGKKKRFLDLVIS